MNKKITIILIALLSFTSESYGAASFAAQQAMAAQAARAIAADLEDADIQPLRTEQGLEIYNSPVIPEFSIECFGDQCELRFRGRGSDFTETYDPTRFLKCILYPSDVTNNSKKIMSEQEIKDHVLDFSKKILKLDEGQSARFSTNIDKVLTNKQDECEKLHYVHVDGMRFNTSNKNSGLSDALKDLITLDMIENKDALEVFKQKILDQNSRLMKQQKADLLSYIDMSVNAKKIMLQKEKEKKIKEEQKLQNLEKFKKDDERRKYKDQYVLLHKMALYLFKQIDSSKDIKDKKERRQVVLDKILSGGSCAGLTTVFLFAALTQEREIEKLLKTNPCPASMAKSAWIKNLEEKYAILSKTKNNKDDLVWFYAVRDLLLHWDENTEFSIAQERMIDRFIALMIQFQAYSHELFPEDATEKYKQEDLALTLENEDGISAVSTFKIKLPHPTQEELLKALEIALKPGHMVFVAADYFAQKEDSAELEKKGKHVIGLLRNSVTNDIYFYNSNRMLERQHEIFRDLSVVKIFLDYCFGVPSDQLKNVEIEAFSFNEPLASEVVQAPAVKASAIAGSTRVSRPVAKDKVSDDQIEVRELDYKSSEQIEQAKEAYVTFLLEFYTNEAKKFAHLAVTLDESQMKENYEEEFDEFIENDRLYIFIAMRQKQIVGILLADVFGSDFFINEIVIHPDYRDRAVDVLFVKKLETLIKAKFPEIKKILCKADEESYHFYDDQGFELEDRDFTDYEGELVSTNFSKRIRAD